MLDIYATKMSKKFEAINVKFSGAKISVLIPVGHDVTM